MEDWEWRAEGLEEPRRKQGVPEGQGAEGWRGRGLASGGAIKVERAGPWEGAELKPGSRRGVWGGSSRHRQREPQRSTCPRDSRARQPTQTPSPTPMLRLFPAPPRTPVPPEVPPPSTLPCLSHPLCTQLQWDAPGRAHRGHRGLRGARGLPGQPREAQEALLSGARTLLHGREVLPGSSRGGDLSEQGREDQR